MIPSSLQRKPFWAPVGLAALSAVIAALVMALLAWLLVTARSTTVIVLRPAETADGGEDRALSAEGQARADLLARMFGNSQLQAHVDVIYVSPALSAQATAVPLAARLAVTPVVVAEDEPRAFERRLLREHRGDRVLVIAHPNTLPELVAALSGVRVPPIPPTQFGTMYIVTVPRIGRANLLSVDY